MRFVAGIARDPAGVAQATRAAVQAILQDLTLPDDVGLIREPQYGVCGTARPIAQPPDSHPPHSDLPGGGVDNAMRPPNCQSTPPLGLKLLDPQRDRPSQGTREGGPSPSWKGARRDAAELRSASRRGCRETVPIFVCLSQSVSSPPKAAESLSVMRDPPDLSESRDFRGDPPPHIDVSRGANQAKGCGLGSGVDGTPEPGSLRSSNAHKDDRDPGGRVGDPEGGHQSCSAGQRGAGEARPCGRVLADSTNVSGARGAEDGIDKLGKGQENGLGSGMRESEGAQDRDHTTGHLELGPMGPERCLLEQRPCGNSSAVGSQIALKGLTKSAHGDSHRTEAGKDEHRPGDSSVRPFGHVSFRVASGLAAGMRRHRVRDSSPAGVQCTADVPPIPSLDQEDPADVSPGREAATSSDGWQEEDPDVTQPEPGLELVMCAPLPGPPLQCAIACSLR